MRILYIYSIVVYCSILLNTIIRSLNDDDDDGLLSSAAATLVPYPIYMCGYFIVYTYNVEFDSTTFCHKLLSLNEFTTILGDSFIKQHSLF